MKSIKNKDIELNDRFVHALRLMEDTGRNVFVTGRAGTGKSTLLQYFRKSTKKNVAVLAPTGVAAVNVKGQTIHSFFSFRLDVTPDTVGRIRPRDKDIYKKLDAIVIDEISMVRADLLDCVDIFLKKHGRKKARPFGGIQMIFIGDLYQLPPVVTSREKALFQDHYKSPYFFSAGVFDEDLLSGQKATFEMELIELEKVYRQKDDKFLDILNAIRNNSVTDDDIREINKRFNPDFENIPGEFYIYLTTTNALAENINMSKLSELPAEEHHYEGTIKGDFGTKALPTVLDLALKKGAQVMLLNNDSLGRWINGSIGRIAEIDEDEDYPDVLRVELADNEIVDVLPYEWEMYEFSYNKEMSRIIPERIGSFTQYPLKLAWAVTIHKSQGMTFDRVVIDIGRGTFSHGQLYVALSRCTTMNGLILKKPVHKKHVLLDRRVVGFVTRYQYKQAEKRLSLEDRLALLDDAIKGKKKLEIVYLKTKDEKSKRTIIPNYSGELEYQGRKFPGVRAFCTNRQDERVFHLERILEMKIVD
ncbi:MAG TPA: AAA family ATPase [Nitrospirae bacterium]|nr:ATP-dependent RecD-like DNA helicase [bacterium BMS3Abin06]HDH13676.1 AAA family ATPase [Nitrospirota bacterium]HDZ02737.1 AAA family ATPase [Nitrospirota bacterium]